METRGASGEVQAFGIKADVQYVQIKTASGLRVVAFPKGEHKALTKGQTLKVGGLVTDPNGYETKTGDVLKQYNWVGEQANTSDQTYVPTDPQADITKEEIPDVVTAGDINNLDPYLKVVEMALTLQIKTDQLRGVTDEMEIDDILTSGCCRIIASAKRLKKLFENEQ